MCPRPLPPLYSRTRLLARRRRVSLCRHPSPTSSIISRRVPTAALHMPRPPQRQQRLLPPRRAASPCRHRLRISSTCARQPQGPPPTPSSRQLQAAARSERRLSRSRPPPMRKPTLRPKSPLPRSLSPSKSRLLHRARHLLLSPLHLLRWCRSRRLARCRRWTRLLVAPRRPFRHQPAVRRDPTSLSIGPSPLGRMAGEGRHRRRRLCPALRRWLRSRTCSHLQAANCRSGPCRSPGHGGRAMTRAVRAGTPSRITEATRRIE